VGTTVYQGVEQSGQQSAEQQAQKAAQQAEAQQQLVQKQEALAVAGPNAQAQTGGSLTGPAGQSFVDILAGYPGQTGMSGSTPSPAAATAASSAPGSAPGGAQPQVNFQDLLQQLGSLTGGGGQKFSGGWQETQPPQWQPYSLAQGY
jgi:hypothetical protein